MAVKISQERDKALTDFAKRTLKGQYCLPNESNQEAFARAATAFSGGDEALAQRLYDYASNQWFAFATPLLANGGTTRGLPISCFLNYVDDSISGLAANFTENCFLSTNGGGIGTYWGHVRSVGETTTKGVDTPGVMPFMHCQDAQVLAYHQGQTRRGATATYMDVSHPEIYEFLAMRSSTNGDVHRKNENLHHGVCISDAFMKAVEHDWEWQLIDPHSKRIHQTVKARDLWIKMLQQRSKLGEPYLFFVDTANRALPQTQKDKGLYIHHSNLCTEITLPTNKDRTAVCCLSSVNVAKTGLWWDIREQFIDDLITMLDNALTVFCQEAPLEMWRAVASARAERSIGLGTLGLHTWFQFNGWSVDSPEAYEFNLMFYEELKKLAVKASQRLAVERGEPEDMKGTGLRHAHLLAIAPNASSSIICGGVSPSVEPMAANVFTQKTKQGSQEVRNPALEMFLLCMDENTPEVWSSISLNNGSVQHLDFMPQEIKDVFKTASEIDQLNLINMAADRQVHICQAQSINLFLPATVSAKELHKLHFSAWELGLKSLYYLRSSSVKSTNTGLLPTILKEEKVEGAACELGTDCTACEG
jgi:ribonucleoside-diphosphate reductase alpha chain